MAFLDETGLAELWSLSKQTFSRVVTGYYTGTGTYGSDNPTSLTFAEEPKMVFISQGTGGSPGYLRFYAVFDWAALKVNSGKTKVYYNLDDSQLYCSLSNNNKTLSWYSNNGGATDQMNDNGSQYQYTAIY